MNLDGIINNTDFTRLNQYLAGIIIFTGNLQKYNADINRDGIINSIDATLLQHILSTT